MKNLLIVLAIAGLTSCSKDSFELNSFDFHRPDLSEVAVSVSYLAWDDECLEGCGDNGQRVVFIESASVSLYNSGPEFGDRAPVMLKHLQTNFSGFALFEDLEPGSYIIVVETGLGEKSRILTTQLHKRAFVDFSF